MQKERRVRYGPKTATKDPVAKYPNRLRELREKNDLTLLEVATRLGISEGSVSRHETGARGLGAFEIEQYVRLYNVTPYELFVPLDGASTKED
jgi:transcriptional regulator with XRE-family HTH domain